MITVQRILFVGLFFSNYFSVADDTSSLALISQQSHFPSGFDEASLHRKSKSLSSNPWSWREVKDQRMVTVGQAIRFEKCEGSAVQLNHSEGSMQIAGPSSALQSHEQVNLCITSDGKFSVQTGHGEAREIEPHYVPRELQGKSIETIAKALSKGLQLNLKHGKEGAPYRLEAGAQGKGGGPIGAFLCGGVVMAVGYVPLLFSLRRRGPNRQMIGQGLPVTNSEMNVSHDNGTHGWIHVVHAAAGTAYQWGMTFLPF